jgi:hypothetical protein
MITYRALFCVLLASAVLSLPTSAQAEGKLRPYQWPPKPKVEKQAPKTEPESEEKRSDNAKESPTPAKDEKKAAKNSSAKEVWTIEDVEKLCANNFRGEHGAASCVSRNARRIGRVKTPYHQNRLQ